MTQDTFDLSIVIPAYKEAAKIEVDLRGAAAFLRQYRLNGEIIVVDDGSPDGTAERASAMRADIPNLTVLSYEPNRGKGHALRYGIMRAKGRNVLFADTGMCVPFNIASIGIEMLDLRMCDIAHGSRRMRGSVVRAQPLYRRLGSRVFKLIIHLFMGIPLYISDTQCGFKLYRREVAQHLYGQAFTDRMMFDAEITLRAIREGYRILEFPVLWSNDPDTRFDPFKGTVTNLKELVRIRWAMLSGQRSAVQPFDVLERGADADHLHSPQDGMVNLDSRTGLRGTV
jgi:dolichyl-phosphate beta-glucosyltransferase